MSSTSLSIFGMCKATDNCELKNEVKFVKKDFKLSDDEPFIPLDDYNPHGFPYEGFE